MRRVPFLAPNLFILHITTLWIFSLTFLLFNFHGSQIIFVVMLSKEGFIALSLKFFGGCSSFEKRKKKRVIDPCSRVILVKNLDGGINISTQISWPPQGRLRHYCLQTLQCSRSQKPHSFFSGTHTLLLYHFTFLKRGAFQMGNGGVREERYVNIQQLFFLLSYFEKISRGFFL